MIELRQGIANTISVDVTAYIGDTTICDFIIRQARSRDSKEIVRYHIGADYSDSDKMSIDDDPETGKTTLAVTITKDDTYKFTPGKFYYEVRFTDAAGSGPYIPIRVGVMKLTLFDE